MVETAAAQVRARGPDGVGVADIMSRVGLTHGGFYAHFPSKDALVAAAAQQMVAQGVETFRRVTAGKSRPDALAAYIDLYLSEAHRDHPERGCPLAALSSEIARQQPETRKVFDAGIALLIAKLADLMPAGAAEERSVLAASVLAEMVGAVSLSRAASNPEMSALILRSARHAVKHRAGLPVPPEENSRP